MSAPLLRRGRTPMLTGRPSAVYSPHVQPFAAATARYSTVGWILDAPSPRSPLSALGRCNAISLPWLLRLPRRQGNADSLSHIYALPNTAVAEGCLPGLCANQCCVGATEGGESSAEESTARRGERQRLSTAGAAGEMLQGDSTQYIIHVTPLLTCVIQAGSMMMCSHCNRWQK